MMKTSKHRVFQKYVDEVHSTPEQFFKKLEGLEVEIQQRKTVVKQLESRMEVRHRVFRCNR